MAKKAGLQEALAGLERLRREPHGAAATEALRHALARGVSLAVAKAAAIAGQAGRIDLAQDLAAAFERFLRDPARTDQGCAAKTAIAEALVRLGHQDEALFLRGIRHAQREPVWGGRVDTAADLRGACAMGLVNLGSPRALVELGDLLADPEPPARIGAARALAVLGREEAVPLLRLRVLAGDPEPRVLTECLLALLRVAPDSALAFAAARLEGDDEAAAEAAAVALGESRLAGAFVPLRDHLGRTVDRERRRVALLAIASLRGEEATAFLLERVAEGSKLAAQEALEALAAGRADEGLRQRIAAAVEARTDAALREAFERAFGGR